MVRFDGPEDDAEGLLRRRVSPSAEIYRCYVKLDAVKYGGSGWLLAELFPYLLGHYGFHFFIRAAERYPETVRLKVGSVVRWQFVAELLELDRYVGRGYVVRSQEFLLRAFRWN